MIKLIHVDDRLAHGQIFHFWCPSYAVEHVIVVDDDACKNGIQQAVMKMGAPSTCLLEFQTAEEAAMHADAYNRSPRGIILLFGSVSVLSRYVELVAPALPTVNLGAMGMKPEREKISTALYLNHNEQLMLKQLLDIGIRLTVQNLPSEMGQRLVKTDGKLGLIKC